jgi:hypothetical protein
VRLFIESVQGTYFKGELLDLASRKIQKNSPPKAREKIEGEVNRCLIKYITKMKKRIQFAILHLGILQVIIFSAVSCEDSPSSELEVQDASFPSMEHINFSIDDNTLNFNSFEDFESMREYLSTIPSSSIRTFEAYISFNSLGKQCDIKGQNYPVDDEFALSLLNQENLIIIGGFKMQYFFDEKMIKVEAVEGNSLKSLSRTYSFDEDVIDILFFDGENTRKALPAPCPGGTKDSGGWDLSNNTRVNYEIVYNRIPGFYNCKAKISKTIFRPGISISVAIGDTYMPSGYESRFMEKNEECNVARNDQDDGTNSSYSLTMVNSAKLYAFRLYANFGYVDSYSGVAISDDEFAVGICNTWYWDCDD